MGVAISDTDGSLDSHVSLLDLLDESDGKKFFRSDRTG